MKPKPPRLTDWPLDVMGKRFRVQWKKLEKDLGMCEASKCLISVDPSCALEQQKDTLLHEVLHAIDHEMDTNMRERQIRLQATGLLHFMRSNPEVIRWLCETDA